MTAAWLVVLTWNGREDTLAMLESLRAASLADTTVLVVDNDSSDETLAAVQEQHPWTRTLQNGANLGYAGGNNRGIAYAREHGAAVIGVINNDTLVRPGFWEPLVRLAKSGLVAVSPDIRYASDPDVSWFYGGVCSREEATARHLQPAEQPARTAAVTSQTLTGCCLVASSATWSLVGHFDEGFFLIFEDADWSMRARALGVTLLLEPASVVEHKVSRSFEGPMRGVGLFYYCRNGLVFAHRWFGLRGALRFLVESVALPGLREFRCNGRAEVWPGLLRVCASFAAASRRQGKAGRLVTSIAARGFC